MRNVIGRAMPTAVTQGLLMLAMASSATHAFGGTPSPNDASRLILLGTNGGPILSATRSEPSALLVIHGKHYLIDAGDGTSGQIVKAGYKPSDIDKIFISHHHADHNAGLPALVSAIWFERAWRSIKKPEVGIYGPPSTQYLLQTSLSYLGVSVNIFTAGVPMLQRAETMFKATDIADDGQFYSDENVRITAAANTHFSEVSRGPSGKVDKSFSYRFDTVDGSIVYSGDTGPSDAVEHLAKDADILVTEVNVLSLLDPKALPGRPQLPLELAEAEALHQRSEHMTPAQIGQLAERAHVKEVVLTHLVPSAVADINPGLFVDGVKKYFAGKVVLGSDFMSVDIAFGTPGQTQK